MNKIIILVLICFLFSCNTIKQKIILENKDNFEDIKEVYYRLIDGIKNKDYEKISSCYSNNAIYGYDINTGINFLCYNKEKQISGIEDILIQYKFLFKKKSFNKIEYEIEKIDSNIPLIKFINLWQNADDNLIEIIEFTKIDNKFYISKHILQKNTD